MSELLRFAVVTFSAIFFVVDPMAAVPAFVAMTLHDDDDKKRAMARKAGIATAVTLAIFAVGGGVIFQVLGITLGAFKIAGGILILLMSLDMMRAQRSRVRLKQEEQDEGLHKDDVAIVPLTIPMLAGPGAIATTMVCMSNADGRALHVAVVFAVIVVTGVLTWLSLRSATWMEKRLGTTGLNVLMRVMGLLLAAVAVQFVVTGVRDVLPDIVSGLRPPT